MMKCIIATARQAIDVHGQNIIQLEEEYAAYFMQFNLQMLILPSLSDIDIIEKLQPKMVLLTGGGDVPARYYDSYVEVVPQYRRNLIEMLLIEFAMNNNIPLLGICRGMQMINGFFGGKLTRGPDESHQVAVDHSIKILDNNDTYIVNSFHRDVIQINALSDKFKAIAVHENLKHVEAFIDAKKQILGLQWHPERMKKSDLCRRYTSKLIAELISEGGLS